MQLADKRIAGSVRRHSVPCMCVIIFLDGAVVSMEGKVGHARETTICLDDAGEGGFAFRVGNLGFQIGRGGMPDGGG